MQEKISQRLEVGKEKIVKLRMLGILYIVGDEGKGNGVPETCQENITDVGSR